MCALGVIGKVNNRHRQCLWNGKAMLVKDAIVYSNDLHVKLLQAILNCMSFASICEEKYMFVGTFHLIDHIN